MDNDDATVQDVQESGATALPEAQDTPQSAEVQDTTEPSETQQDAVEDGQEAQQPQDQGASDVDDKLKTYAQSQGIDLDSPSAIKAAKIAMAAQSEATKNYHKTQELEKATNIDRDQIPQDATPQQQENIRIRNLELQIGVQNWRQANPEKLALEGEMVNILQDPNKRLLVQEGYLSLDDVYSLAKASAPDNSSQLKSQGGQEALERLAQKQTAAVPRGSATTQTPAKEKPFEELSIAEMEAKLGFVKR